MVPDLIDGAIVAAIAALVGFLELVGRHPQYARLVVRTSAGRQYVAVNVLAGLVAFVLALLLEVKFREPDRPLLVLACGCTAIAVLRSAPVTRAGLQGPVRLLVKLKDAFTVEIDRAAKNIQAESDAHGADSVTRAIEGLTWDDREGLAAMCLMIANRYLPKDRELVARWIADAQETDLPDQVALFGLASWLRDHFTETVLIAAADRVRNRGA